MRLLVIDSNTGAGDQITSDRYNIPVPVLPTIDGGGRVDETQMI
jgi:hypothetical protein